MEKEWKPDLYVVARFLDRLWQPDVTYTRSQLQRAVRLNYDLYRRYLDFLEKEEFLHVREDPHGEKIVRMSPKGLEAHAQLVGWIRRVIGENAL